MHPQKSRFVALCQQLLVLGAVFAALVPAASVVNLDVVRETPSERVDATSAALAAYRAVAGRPSEVPAEVVDPEIREVALTPAVPAQTGRATAAAYVRPFAASARIQAVADTEDGTTTVTSTPQAVEGFGTVGLTWAPESEVEEGEVSFEVRTRTDGEWSDWQELDYHDEHGPDPRSDEARNDRPGTQEALVGHVDQVQVRAQGAPEAIPADLELAVIDPGNPAGTKVETPDIDTSQLPVVPDAVPNGEGGLVEAPATEAPAAEAPATEPALDEADGEADDARAGDGIVLAAATAATKPVIYSRAQWGANEKLREQRAATMGVIQGGFVHHTVNANSYTPADVPGIIRSIYAYHVKSRGWSDLGYNFLIDRFGRIWEGRAGGVDRPVVGAHTEGYNSNSFAGSAIGNFDIAAPPQEVVGAFGALMAWKLSISGVSAAATNVRIGKKVFASSIMGHRDTKATACPGKHLYARIPDIRRIATAAQTPVSYAPRTTNLVGSAHPDIIARRASDKRGVILPTTGLSGFGARSSAGFRASNRAVVSADLTGDRRADLLVVSPRGKAVVRPGNGRGRFGKGMRTVSFAGRKQITALGDVNRDGRNDVFAVDRRTGKGVVYFGQRRAASFTARTLKSRIFGGYGLMSAGDVDGNGTVDLLGRDAAGRLWVHPGRGNGGFPRRAQLTGAAWRTLDAILPGDFTRDGRLDLLVRIKGSGNSYVLPGLGRNAFGRGIGPHPVLRKQTALLGAADVTSDGLPDVVATYGNRLDVLPRAAGTDVGAPVVTNLDLSAADLVLNAGDWNRDGHGDVLTRERDNVVLYLGNGRGGFSRAGVFGGGWAAMSMIAAVGDMTGDGKPDLMAQGGGAVRLYPGNGATGVGTPYAVHSAVAGTQQIGVGRWDGDGAPDVMVRNGAGLTLYPGNGPSGFALPRPVSSGLAPYDWVIGVGDLSLGGPADLVVRERGSGLLYALQGKGDGTVAAPRLLGYGFEGYDLAG